MPVESSLRETHVTPPTNAVFPNDSAPARVVQWLANVTSDDAHGTIPSTKKGDSATPSTKKGDSATPSPVKPAMSAADKRQMNIAKAAVNDLFYEYAARYA